MVQAFEMVPEKQAVATDWDSVADLNQKPAVLFLPAAIKSHVLPSLYLADLLVDMYRVVYAVTNSVIAEIVTQNGYETVQHSQWRVGYMMEPYFVADKHKRVSIGGYFCQFNGTNSTSFARLMFLN